MGITVQKSVVKKLVLEYVALNRICIQNCISSLHKITFIRNGVKQNNSHFPVTSLGLNIYSKHKYYTLEKKTEIWADIEKVAFLETCFLE